MYTIIDTEKYCTYTPLHQWCTSYDYDTILFSFCAFDIYYQCIKIMHALKIREQFSRKKNYSSIATDKWTKRKVHFHSIWLRPNKFCSKSATPKLHFHLIMVHVPWHSYVIKFTQSHADFTLLLHIVSSKKGENIQIQI